MFQVCARVLFFCFGQLHVVSCIHLIRNYHIFFLKGSSIEGHIDPAIVTKRVSK